MDCDVKEIKRDRTNEKGAAVVMALLISFLLLVASAGLLMESSMNTQNVTDLTAEQQAYNAAESGIQSAVNVLRGNVVPSPLIDSSKPATDPANKINFVKALKLSSSNLSGDTSTVPRLSRWMSYHSTYTDRVPISPSTYTPNAGYAYTLSLSDPDHTGSIVSYTTTGKFNDHDTGNASQITYGSGANKLILTYTPASVTDLDCTLAPVDTTRLGDPRGFRLNASTTSARTSRTGLRSITNWPRPRLAAKRSPCRPATRSSRWA